jgi:hypothetical protein
MLKTCLGAEGVAICFLSVGGIGRFDFDTFRHALVSTLIEVTGIHNTLYPSDRLGCAADLFHSVTSFHKTLGKTPH